MSSFGWLCLINSHSLPYSLFRSLQLSEEAAKKENELNELEEDMERLRNRLQQPSENYQDEVTNLYQSSQNHSLGEKKASQKLLKFEDILSRIRHN
jgi:predicted  nucleic acid-binding Zn-ribbon protein